jgi:hypothetical protein
MYDSLQRCTFARMPCVDAIRYKWARVMIATLMVAVLTIFIFSGDLVEVEEHNDDSLVRFFPIGVASE